MVVLKVDSQTPPINPKPYSVTSFPVTDAERAADAHMDITEIAEKYKVTFEWDVIDTSFASFYDYLRSKVQFTVYLILPTRTALSAVTMYRSELECGAVVPGTESSGMKWSPFKVTFIEV
jgi:hypothetical protein